MSTMPRPQTALRSQPTSRIAQENAVEATLATDAGLVTPQMMKATMRTPVTPATTLSTPNLLR